MVNREEIIFTKNATEAINLVASSYGSVNIQNGDEIIISMLEHHSNIVPWHFLRERNGAVLKWVNIDDNGLIDIDHLNSLITKKTKMIAMTHMSNVLGTVQPIKDIVNIAHNNDIPVLIDGTQGAVHDTIDVDEVGVAF